MEKKNNLHDRARIRIAQLNLSTKFFGSLPHTSDPNADAARSKRRDLSFNPLAIVTYHNHQSSFSLRRFAPSFCL
jgi:hypothetical protein